MSSRFFLISNKVKKFNKVLKVDGDKSISIRWLFLASQATGISKAKNLLRSEDVLSAIECLKKLGVRINFKQFRKQIPSSFTICWCQADKIYNPKMLLQIH